MKMSGWRCASALALLVCCSVPADAATIFVGAGGDLQAALDAAQPGDTILLAEGAEFVGNFVLPAKPGDKWITIRSGAPDPLLPPAGTRVSPAHAPLLARLRSPNSSAALRTAPGAHHWALRYLEFAANLNGQGDIIQLGDGSSAQNTLSSVPHHLILRHVYVHGDPRFGQKRGIALNAAHVTIADSHVAECKGIGQDTQAIGGWNGPGPFLIENNYLEAAGENVLFGGADPAIAGLVADGITFRRNYLSRPMAWKQPILATPAGVTANAQSGGSLGAGTYAYRVVARGTVGQGTAGRSTASAEVAVTLSGTGAVRVRWQAVPGASEYRVYGRTPGAQATYWRVTTTELVDTGAAGTAEAVPTTAGTVWSVKNIFELKNARNVVVENNIFENHWKESQPGYSIVLTPRNSNGACTWCVVENVRLEYNLVRNVAAGINLLGYDIASRPTKQTRNIVVRHNVFQDMTTALGGNGWFMLIGDEPRDVTVEHNTIESDGTTVVYTYGGSSTDPREIYGFRMIANAAKHGKYGMGGTTFAYGLAILNGYYPDHVFAANYLAGASTSRYPAGTLVTLPYEDQFVDVAADDFAVRASSFLRGAAPDGTDVGADFPELKRRLLGVDHGLSAAPPTADFVVNCADLSCEFTCASAAAGSALAGRTWSFGDGSTGTGTPVQHAFAAGGTYAVQLTVVDEYGLSASTSKNVTVEPPNVAPTADFTAVCADLTCTFTDRSTDADGTIASRSWSFGGGGSPVTFRFSAPGSYAVSLAVRDNDGASASKTRTIGVTSAVHVGLVSGGTTKWYSKTNPLLHYWSADIVVAVHGADERPIAGATVSTQWSGAVVKAASCVTGADGRCTLRSGTLSMHRSWVTMTIAGVTAPLAIYEARANHGFTSNTSGTAITYTKP
jgi:PKD repeat protein